ncbi:MAG: inositol 2-dehydrogenase [Verrucomicrobiae bacterium]|nr:inositol 2-dehydrogenase [Verrucomicrobiae bacterium]
MTPSPIPVGLVGAGRIGRLHAEHLRCRLPEADLRMVTDVDPGAARSCAERFGIPQSGSDYRELLARPDLAAVIVCSPTDTHVGIIEAAAAAGKHVFCEKPIDAGLAPIDRALAAVDRAGVLLQIGFNRRFDPNFRRVREAVVRGEIGTPHQVLIVSRDPAPPPLEYVRRSGGIFLDMTIHDFDMARFLVGSEIVEVYATGSVRVDPAIGEAGDLDTATVLLTFRNGVVATIQNCRQAVYGYDQRVEVFGSAGSIRIDNNHPNTALLSGPERVQRDLPLRFFMDRYLDSYLEEMRAFLAAIRSGSPSPVPGPDGRIPVLIAHAARQSHTLNRPVRLDEIDRPTIPHPPTP